MSHYAAQRGRRSAGWPVLRARRRRWAERLRLVFKVDVEVCARGGDEARIVGFVTSRRWCGGSLPISSGMGWTRAGP